MVTVLRPLSTSELLDRTFHLYRNHFLLFVGIIAIPQLVVLALRIAGIAMLGMHVAIGSVLMSITAALVSFAAIQISQAATVMAVSSIHLDHPVSIGSAFSAAKSSMLRVIGISLAVGISIGIATLFFIVPGILVALMWALAIPVTVLEGGGLSASTTRSQRLTKGGRGRIFVIYALLFVLIIVVGVIFQVPMGIAAAVVGRGNPLRFATVIQAASAAGTFLSTSLVGGLATIALTLIYYDQRVRKEGFDLQLMMASLQPEAQAAAVGTNL